MKKIIFTKTQFIYFIKRNIKSGTIFEPDLEACNKALSTITIGTDGLSIGLTILWLMQDRAGICHRNKISNNRLIKWLKSEMRWYNELGSFSPFVKIIVNRYFLIRKEKLEKEINNFKSA